MRFCSFIYLSRWCTHVDYINELIKCFYVALDKLWLYYVTFLLSTIPTVIVPALVILAVEDWTESCTCVVKHGGHVALIQELNLQIYTISWCQEWDLFEHSSYNCIWNSSSENNRTFHITSLNISSFNIRSARLDLPPFSSFKSIHVQTLTVYLSLNNSHGKIYDSFNGLVDTWRYPQAI